MIEGELSGTSVRQLNTSPAAVWYADTFGTGVRGIKTPGGNEGPLIRMYHPRLGLWIVQQILEETLSYRSSRAQSVSEGREEEGMPLTIKWSTISSSDRNRS